MLVCENSKAWKFAYDVLTWFTSMLALDYAAIGFVLLDGRRSLRALNNTYWYVYIIAIIWYVIVRLIPPYKPKDATAAAATEKKKAN